MKNKPLFISVLEWVALHLTVVGSPGEVQRPKIVAFHADSILQAGETTHSQVLFSACCGAATHNHGELWSYRRLI